MIKLVEGQKAPDFELLNQYKKKVNLSDFIGNKVVLYFYPKDDTPGCAIEACNFRDNMAELKKLNVEILGISNDDQDSHDRFSKKLRLSFNLLCDTDKKVSKAYGVFEKKKFMGREYMGITRSTFLIDEKGKIRKIFYRVDPKAHIVELFKTLKT